MKKTCETCAAYLEIFEGGIGECLLNPPQLYIDSVEPSPSGSGYYCSVKSAFPEVTKTYYCVDGWRKKEDEDAD